MRIAECELFMKGDFTLNVKDRPWKVFKAFGEDGLFQIKATSSGVDAIKLKDGLDKTIPYISRSANNNGIVDFIDDSNREFGIDERGNITIGLDTQTAFYQPHEFVTGQNIHIVSGDKINRYTAQFLVVILRNQMNAKFNWGGNGATLGRLKRLKIMLPVNSSGQPDYEFMEQYVSERESTECWKSICGTYQSQDVPDLSEKEWGKYRFDEIFEIRPGKRLENRNKILGDIPFVGASDSNNGITGFVGNVNESLDSNTLGVSYNGAPCIAFHHPYECIFTDDVKHLHLKDHDDNEYVHLFLATVVGMQRVKYSYGYKFNEQRMKKQIIMLPMTDDGGPDYEYMENFVRSKESILLRRYCDYAEAKSSNSNSRYLRYKFTPSLPSNFLKSAGM